MPRFIEVSHAIRDRMKTYPGLPPPRTETLWSYEESRERYEGKAEFYIASLHLCGNTGTYVDAPIHRFPHGADLAAYPLERLADLDTVVIDVSTAPSRSIGPEALRGIDPKGKAVLFHTGWARYWGAEAYFGENPYLTAGACRELVERGARFVGIDSLNIDDTDDLERPAHTILLGAGIPVCEHMTNLDRAPSRGGRLHAVPIAWVGGASFPVRAYVIAGV